MSEFPFRTELQELAVIEHMLATGEILPSQLPTKYIWTPEKKLAAAVFVSGLVEIRNHGHDPRKRRRVEEEVKWVFSNDTRWPYSFLRLCELLQLHPDYVRRIVRAWLEKPPTRRPRLCSAHRHAA